MRPAGCARHVTCTPAVTAPCMACERCRTTGCRIHKEHSSWNQQFWWFQPNSEIKPTRKARDLDCPAVCDVRLPITFTQSTAQTDRQTDRHTATTLHQFGSQLSYKLVLNRAQAGQPASKNRSELRSHRTRLYMAHSASSCRSTKTNCTTASRLFILQLDLPGRKMRRIYPER